MLKNYVHERQEQTNNLTFEKIFIQAYEILLLMVATNPERFK